MNESNNPKSSRLAWCLSRPLLSRTLAAHLLLGKSKALVKAANGLYLNHGGATWPEYKFCPGSSRLSGCSSQTFSFNRIGVISLGRIATYLLTSHHCCTPHAAVRAIKRNYERAVLSSYLGRGRPPKSCLNDSSQDPFSPDREAVLLRFPLQ